MFTLVEGPIILETELRGEFRLLYDLRGKFKLLNELPVDVRLLKLRIELAGEFGPLMMMTSSFSTALISSFLSFIFTS